MQRRLPPRQGGVAGDRAAGEGGADERVDPPRGGARDPVQPVVDDDALSPLQRRAVPRARCLRERRQRPHRVERGEPGRAAPGHERRRRDRAGGRADLARRGARAAAGGRRRADPRRRLDARRRLRRSPHRDARGGGRGARARRRHPPADTRHRDRARPAPRGARRAHRPRPDRDRARRQRGGHLGAAGGGDGRRIRAVRAGRPPARRDAGRGRARDPARRAVLPRSRPPRLRQGGGRRHARRRIRAESARALDRRRAVGPRRQPGRVGHRSLRTAARGRDPPVPVPRGRRRDPPALSPGCDDARRQSAARAGAGRARLLGRRRSVAQRLRGSGRPRQGPGGVDDRRRHRGRRHAVPGVALRAGLPEHRLRRGDRSRGVQVLLPAALPARHEHGGPRLPAEPAPRVPRGARRGLRHEERLGARRLLRAGPPVAARGGGPARVRLEGAAVPRPARRGAPRDPRPRRHLRPHVVRQDRGLGPGRAGAARAGVRRPHRSPGRACRLHAVPQRRRRDRRRPDRHAAGGGSLPRRDRRGGGRLRSRLARAPRGRRRARSAT